jgi:hypothetical protein
MPGDHGVVLKATRMRQLCPEHGEGIHSAVMFDEIGKFREFYCEAAKTTLQNDEVLMILTYFETADTVKYYLREAGVDVDLYGRADSLFVIDSVEQFFGSTVENTLRFIELLNKKARRQGRKGLAVIVDMDAFFHLKEEGLVRYERSILPKDNQDKFTCMVCAYHRSNFEKIPKGTQETILKQHSVHVAL